MLNCIVELNCRILLNCIMAPSRPPISLPVWPPLRGVGGMVGLIPGTGGAGVWPVKSPSPRLRPRICALFTQALICALFAKAPICALFIFAIFIFALFAQAPICALFICAVFAIFAHMCPICPYVATGSIKIFF